MTLRDLAPVRALAEERARSRVQMFADIEGEPCAPDGDVATVANVELALLTDLSRPDSRDAVARLVADGVGVGAFNGVLFFLVSGERWLLRGNGAEFLFVDADPLNPEDRGGDTYAIVPGISTITDPAEALRVIALAVLA